MPIRGLSTRSKPGPTLSSVVLISFACPKTAKETERDYLSVKLDDPSFPAPIYATLIEVDGQEGLQLIWARANRD
jgi:uncharacterized protein (DUF736 family)